MARPRKDPNAPVALDYFEVLNTEDGSKAIVAAQTKAKAGKFVSDQVFVVRKLGTDEAVRHIQAGGEILKAVDEKPAGQESTQDEADTASV